MMHSFPPRSWRAVLLMCCAAAAIAGCASAPDPQLLSLPLPADMGMPDASGQQAVLVVRRVSIPEYMQTNHVRYRAADSVLAEWPDVVWAERLESGLTDHLLMRLRARLPGWTVCDRSCPPLGAARVLAVDLSPLDHLRSAKELHAQAHWQITARTESNKATLNGMQTWVLPVASDSAPGQAVTLAHMLDELSQTIAQQLTQQLAQDNAQATHPVQPSQPSGIKP